MRISGPTNLRIKELSCILFKTRTWQPSESLYFSIKEKGIKEPLLVAPFNGNPAYSKANDIHFNDLWELRQKLTQVSKLLSRFAEFLPEELTIKSSLSEPRPSKRNKRD